MKMVHVWKGFIALLALLVLANSQQDQSVMKLLEITCFNETGCAITGFISIDCGTEESYTDTSSSLTYTTDSDYIESGVNKDISPFYKGTTLKRQQFGNVRSFPEGTRNCYTLNVPKGKDTSYLLRAYFMYGNYDDFNNPPKFELYLGVDLWYTVKLENASHVVTQEIIHAPSTNYLYVCLVDIGHGTPFISGLELRHLNDSIYKRSSGSLDLLYRYYTYTNSLDNIRYTDDIYDRIWKPMYLADGSSINTSSEVNSLLNIFKLPSSVMQAAITPTTLTSKPISFTHKSNDPNTEFSVFLHIAELQSHSSTQIREFNITVNGLHFYGPYIPLYLTSDTIYNNVSLTTSELNITLQSTNRSTLPPIVNAIELFTVKQFSKLFTSQIDVDAMMDIKSFSNRTKTWQGDPCLPKAYSWTDLNCSYYSSNSPRITSLNLSSNGLTGYIPESIANLTALQILDLSNNDLSGQIPAFLSDLSQLKILKLEGNNFTGPVPEKLLEKSMIGSLSLSVEDNQGVCSSTSCTSKEKKKTFIGPVAACAALFVLLLAGFISFLLFNRRKKQKGMSESVKNEDKLDNVEPGNRIKRQGELARFSYSDVTNMTNKFQRELGKGGFGIVYYGSLKDGTQVAVKMLSQTVHASQQFSTEVELLMSIRHKNLVSLVGYCEEGSHLAIIYEYMASGNLLTVLSESHSLTWKERLQIAIDSAQGLDYLHNGCRPPIVHRDVKTPNILLNKNLQAKIADFGLSKIFPDENKSYVSTRVIGTPGYLDPEYHVTEQLNEKSDVYSFGVVLLELMTGKPAIVRVEELERVGLAQWVGKKLEGGDIWSIVDEKMSDVHNLNSLWRSTDIAMTCVKLTSAERPTMSHIVTELKACLAMELDPRNSRTDGPDESIEMSPMVSFSAVGPSAR